MDRQRLLLWGIFLSFPLPFIATLTGWFTAEVGRQPWTVYGLMRTADAVTPHLTVGATLTSLAFFGVIYVLIFSFGTLYIYRLLRAGPSGVPQSAAANAKRPLALSGGSPEAEVSRTEGGL
jgi:cytochrome d ubiquinol oxidase subunit I